MKWISPAKTMDMLYDDPARAGPDSEFGFALLWATDSAGNRHRVADLAEHHVGHRAAALADKLVRTFSRAADAVPRPRSDLRWLCG